MGSHVPIQTIQDAKGMNLRGKCETFFLCMARIMKGSKAIVAAILERPTVQPGRKKTTILQTSRPQNV